MNFILSMLPSLFKLGDKLIVDQDKKQEFAFKVQEMMNNFAIHMLETKTYPWIDGLVKLAYAGEAIIKGLIRPLGALGMLAFAIYCEINLIELSEGVQAILYGSAPAWGVSRHVEEKRKKEDTIDWD